MSGPYQSIIDIIQKIKLYEKEPPFEQSNMFKNPMWHPGYQDQSNYACLIHALNLYVGGPLFDTAQKFLTLYQSRCKMRKTRVPEFPWERGLSLKNLRRIIYVESENKWLTPKIDRTATSDMINEFIANGLSLIDFLQMVQQSRVIIQYLTYPQIDTMTNAIIKAECHAAVLYRDGTVWWLLDCAAERPINLNEEKEAAHKLLCEFKVLNIIDMVNDAPSKEFADKFRREWQLIHQSQVILSRGGYRRLRKSRQNYERKCDRKRSPTAQGSSRYRKSKPVTPVIKRRPRKDSILGMFAENTPEQLKKQLLEESTLKAKEAKQIIKAITSPASVSENQGQSLENDKGQQAQLMEQKISRLIKEIRTLKVLPLLDHYLSKFTNEEQVNAAQIAFKEVFLESSSKKLAKHREALTLEAKKNLGDLEGGNNSLLIESYVEERMRDLETQYCDQVYLHLKSQISHWPSITLTYYEKTYKGLGKGRLKFLKECHHKQQ